MQWIEYRAAVRNRNLTLLVVGRSVSWYGNALAPMALAFAVIDLGLSVGAVSAAVLARSVPQLLLVLVGGNLADRGRPRWLLVGGTGVAGLSQGALAAALITGHGSLAVIVGLSMINGASGALSGPASAALFRGVVPEQDWHAATVLQRAGQELGLMLGMSTGGLLIGMAGPGVAIAVDAGTFLVATICYLVLKAPGAVVTATGSMLRQLVDGFDYLRRHPWLILLNLQSLTTMIAFACCLQVLAAVAADSTFGRAGLGIAGALQTAGSAVGVIIAGALPMATRLTRPVLLGSVVALPILVLAVGPWWWGTDLLLVAFAAAMLLTGLALQVAGVWKGLFVLRHVDAAILGRVNSYGILASVGGLSLGEALAGPLHGLFGLSGALLIMVGVVLGLTAAVAASSDVRKVTYEPSPC